MIVGSLSIVMILGLMFVCCCLIEREMKTRERMGRYGRYMRMLNFFKKKERMAMRKRRLKKRKAFKEE